MAAHFRPVGLAFALRLIDVRLRGNVVEYARSLGNTGSQRVRLPHASRIQETRRSKGAADRAPALDVVAVADRGRGWFIHHHFQMRGPLGTHDLAIRDGRPR